MYHRYDIYLINVSDLPYKGKCSSLEVGFGIHQYSAISRKMNVIHLEVVLDTKTGEQLQ